MFRSNRALTAKPKRKYEPQKLSPSPRCREEGDSHSHLTITT